MKKVFLYLFIGCMFLTGCGKQSEDVVLNNFKDKVNGTKSYYLSGKMELVNNEDVYDYQINVSYKEDNNYRIELTNMVNEHKQIILRNKDGVYVITPSLNKSFKFQSDWPYNNSQVYLLGSILDDIENDSDRDFIAKDSEYIFTSNVNYPNNDKLIKQEIYFNDEYLPTKVIVYDKDNNKEIIMEFDKIDLKTEFNDTYFNLDSILKTEDNSDDSSKPETDNKSTEEKTKETATIDDVIYPMYLPTNTYLANQEKVSTDDGERLILTFGGDSPFTLVEETANYNEKAEIIPTYGDIELIGSSLAVVNDNSLNWFMDGIEYYIVSDVVNTSELLNIAKSISVLPVSK